MKNTIISLAVTAILTVSLAASAGSDTECTKCMYSNCQQELMKCVADDPVPNSACMQIVKCIGVCAGNEKCTNACGNNRSQASINKAVSLIACSINNCRSQCAD